MCGAEMKTGIDFILISLKVAIGSGMVTQGLNKTSVSLWSLERDQNLAKIALAEDLQCQKMTRVS